MLSKEDALAITALIDVVIEAELKIECERCAEMVERMIPSSDTPAMVAAAIRSRH